MMSQAVIDAWYERAWFYQQLAARARTAEGRRLAETMNQFYSDRIESETGTLPNPWLSDRCSDCDGPLDSEFNCISPSCDACPWYETP